ncbi:hypothetical protein PTSG_12753 [Salpingoeca rosetta]|uniref:Uncharacterized protein n=1 Tax=Salpingoeca rosetta (strain ATCC 50818 / BSB-021) TaxID=946362 RepID=F2UJZ4_SALR5|nr:uncharacterized protein PTSG_12753 [Salpingoeca rosetta]EGD77443.1 hypothetical protein PTSG_12753 [Salpingoeca rosetta]|eukprot:XP_004990331.1 hypothetical protein PTSG_12753 [Salpingoeca rosetta]
MACFVSANRRVDSVPDRLRVRSNSAFVTSEFRFQRVSSHRSRLASMLGAAGLRTSNMGSRPNTAPAPHTSLTSRLRHSNSPL